MGDGKEIMDKERYIEMALTDPVSAKEYKKSSIPDKLFKYISLCEDQSEDSKRLDSLERGELYLGKCSEYNDPFEGAFLFIDENKLKHKGWKVGMVSDIYRWLTDEYGTCSLANTSEQNMPMWAYYANNHKGFCVEYSFSDEQKDYIFPVFYEDIRPEATSQFTNLMNDVMKIALKNPGEPVSERFDQLKPESSRTNLLIFLTIAAKHKSWRHEKEYRIIVPSSSRAFSATPSRVYAGKDCSKENLKRLTNIAKKYNKDGVPVELYKMKFDSNNKYFQLNKERIV